MTPIKFGNLLNEDSVYKHLRARICVFLKLHKCSRSVYNIFSRVFLTYMTNLLETANRI